MRLWPAGRPDMIPPYFLLARLITPNFFFPSRFSCDDGACIHFILFAEGSATMPRKKCAQDFFRKGREKGSGQCTEGIDGSTVLKQPQEKTLREYKRMIGLWNQYAEEHADDDPSPYDLKSLKDFMKEIAFGIDGAEDDPNPGEGTVLVYWKQFMAGWRREHDAIPGNTTLSVTNFIKYELPEILRRESNIKLVKTKRPRRFGTKNHFLHLGRQLWGDDWVEYEKPATRVYDWAGLMAIVCSSARIGEYIESSCRAGSGRGLYYKDVKFGVFRNEHGNAEFAIQLHSLYEGLVPMPLICNAMLPILAILISAKAFSGYDTIEDLLALEPSEGEMMHLQWRDSILDEPFFKSMSSRRTRGSIETAVAVRRRLRALGFRAGYANPPTIHDFRAEGLYWINQLYSLAQRMKHAGPKDASTYDKHYMPNNSGTDGQGSYFGTEVRSVVNDLFRGLTVARNPHLPQSLPAEQKEALRTSPKFAAIDEELMTLRGRDDKKSASRCKKLHGEKRKLADQKLRKWQKDQPYRPSTTTGVKDLPCYHRSIFNRVRFLMPERDRLAESLFETDTLRSPTGLQALRDMIAFFDQVWSRTCLCQCGKSTRRRKLPESARAANDLQSTYDWKHVYSCFKNSYSGFAEHCFLCNKWVVGERQWSDHCRSHLACPETLPVNCDPLTYGGVLATAGYCVLCMADLSLAPEVRLRQFLDRGSWRDHVYRHYQTYVQSVEDGKPAACPHPNSRGDIKFDSAKQLEFHLLDVHCPDFIKESSILEVLKEDEDVTSPKKKRQLSIETSATEIKTEPEYYFIDQTTEITRRHPSTVTSTLFIQGSMSPTLNCHENALSEDKVAQIIEALSSQPSLMYDDNLQAPTIPTTTELLTYTSLPELLAPSEGKESTPDTTRSPASDVPLFDISEFINLSPTPEPELSVSHLAVNDSKEIPVDTTLTTYDDPSDLQNTDWLLLNNLKEWDPENDYPRAAVQLSGCDTSLDEITVDTASVLHPKFSPEAQPESCITVQPRTTRPVRIKLRTKGQGTTEEALV
ncbi:hypothetical protein TOPH_06078, partial [Tolypocladium ophioglossoides CBS 100239]